MRRFEWRVIVLLLGLAAGSASAEPHDSTSTPPAGRDGGKEQADLLDLPLEDLLNVEVRSVTRRKGPLTGVAAAVYVLTQEDIQRSGSTSIPEALRLVPGLEVSRIDANKWAVTARGFNGRFANKLLVLMDGRAVYSHQFSGVFWELQDVVMEDIDRIEVIRGPGAGLWGANAVNGVVNIVTRKAHDTRGGLLSALGGTEERANVALRFGGPAGASGSFRMSAKYRQFDELLLASGQPSHDGWQLGRGGFRSDWQTPGGDAWTLIGDVYSGTVADRQAKAVLDPPSTPIVDTSVHPKGGSLLGRWERHRAPRSDLWLQGYFEVARRTIEADGDPGEYGVDPRLIGDLEFGQRSTIGRRQDLIWGFGYRRTYDRYVAGSTYSYDPREHADNLHAAYLQDEFRLAGERLHLILGGRLEYNDHNGLEVNPDVRALYHLSDRQSVWGALSRAVRSPSRTEQDVRANLAAYPDGAGGAVLASLFGNHDFRAEIETALQAGYRLQPADRVLVDLTAYLADYDDLRTFETAPPFAEAEPPPPHTVQPTVPGNRLEGRAAGLEVAATWEAGRRFTLSGWYSWFHLRLDPGPGSTDPNAGSAEGDSPKHQAQVRSFLDLPRHFALDTVLRYVGPLENQEVPDRLTCDLRFAYAPTRRFEASLLLNNLLQRRHAEWGAAEIATSPAETERSISGKITWRF